MKKNIFIIFAFSILLSASITLVLHTITSLDYQITKIAIFSGAATSGTGYVNLTAATNNAITILSSIDFGAGYINTSYTAANITSNITYNKSSGWINSSPTWNASTNHITINNTGNTLVNITFVANQSVAAWIGGTNPDARAFFGDNENNSCTGIYNTQHLQINTTEQLVCTSTTKGLGFDFYDISDEIQMNVQLLLPNNLTAGQRSTTITFTSTANQ